MFFPFFPFPTIDLFSLFVLFSQCGSCDIIILENLFFQFSFYSRAYICARETRKGRVPLRTAKYLYWPQLQLLKASVASVSSFQKGRLIFGEF